MLQFADLNRFASTFGLIPKMITTDDLVQIFRQVTKDKNRGVIALNYDDFTNSLIRICVYGSEFVNCQMMNSDVMPQDPIPGNLHRLDQINIEQCKPETFDFFIQNLNIPLEITELRDLVEMVDKQKIQKKNQLSSSLKKSGEFQNMQKNVSPKQKFQKQRKSAQMNQQQEDQQNQNENQQEYQYENQYDNQQGNQYDNQYGNQQINEDDLPPDHNNLMSQYQMNV